MATKSGAGSHDQRSLNGQHSPRVPGSRTGEIEVKQTMNRSFSIASALLACGCGSTTSVEAGSDATSDSPMSHVGPAHDGTTDDGSSETNGATDAAGGADA